MLDRHRHDGFIWALIFSLIINLLFVFTLLTQRFNEKSPRLLPFVVSLSVRQQPHSVVSTALADPTDVLRPARKKNAANTAAIVSPQNPNSTPKLPTRNSDEETVSKPVSDAGMTSNETEPPLSVKATADQNAATPLGKEIVSGLSIFEDKTAGDNYTAPEYFAGEKPPYPKQAERNGWAGTVLLNLSINAKGEVEKVGVAKSSGYKLLDQQARQSVGAWSFKPARRNGVAVAATVQQPVIFRPTQPGQDQ